MRTCIGVVIVIAFRALSATAGEPAANPAGPPPMVMTAQVAGKTGDEVVFMKFEFLNTQVTKGGKQEWERTSKSVNSKPKKVGKKAGSDVRAFNAEGKAIDSAELAKLLAQPRPVVVYFPNPTNGTGAPDPYYRALFSKAVVFLEIACDPFEEPGVAKPAPQPTKK